MRVLGLDAATSFATVAATDGAVQFQETWRPGRALSDTLAVTVERALDALGGAEKLDAVAVGIGPGSYTGIRVALALAKGLCKGSGVPLTGLSTLEVVALGCGAWKGTICAAIPAGSSRVAIGVFEGPWSSWGRRGPERAESTASAADAIVPGSLVCGEGADLLPDTVDMIRAPVAFDAPRGDILALFARGIFPGRRCGPGNDGRAKLSEAIFTGRASHGRGAAS